MRDQYEGKDCQADIVGHRRRQHEGEHGDEMHRPYAASHGECGRRQPDAVRGSLGHRQASANTQGRVRREGSDQDGQGDEIRIVRSGNHHRNRPHFLAETSEAPFQNSRYGNRHHRKSVPDEYEARRKDNWQRFMGLMAPPPAANTRVAVAGRPRKPAFEWRRRHRHGSSPCDDMPPYRRSRM
jgi:hypothetical protein